MIEYFLVIRMKERIKGSASLLIATVIWGSAFIAQSVGMDLIGPFTFQAARCALGALFLLPVILIFDAVKGNWRGFFKGFANIELWKTGLICGIALFIAAGLQQVGLVYTTAGKSGFITAMYIVLVPILGVALHKKPPFTAWISVVIAVIGLYLLSCVGVSEINAGDLLTLGCALAFAVQITLIDRLAGELDGLRLNCIQAFVCAVLSAVTMFATETPDVSAVTQCWLPIAYAGIFSMGIAYSLQIVGQKYLEPTPASLIMSLESVFAVLCAWLILGEIMRPVEMIGCGLVFTAVVLSQIPLKDEFRLKVWHSLKRFFLSVPGKICIAIVLALALGGISFLGWYFFQPKVHDVTIELGSDLPELEEFLTEYAYPEKWVHMDTPENEIDLNKVQDQPIQFKYIFKRETVTLSIIDTTPPVLTTKEVTATPGAQLTAEEFVESVTDLSDTSVRFSAEIPMPKTYDDVILQIIAEDAYGNTTAQSAVLHYIWVRESVTLELGQTLYKEDILLYPEKDRDLLDDAVLEEISASPVGEYTVECVSGTAKCQSVITIVDTTPPELELKKLVSAKGVEVKPEEFVEFTSDLSGEVTLRYVDPLPDFNLVAEQAVTIEAADPSGNTTRKETTLEVVEDTTPPTITGLTAITIAKNGKLDLTTGVTARDDRDGIVKFTVDSSKVNIGAAGTYYATYTAVDRAGNRTVLKRQIVVIHNAADTAALVKSIAASLSSNPETIRDYVRSNIGYTHDWGGNDPVWFGFKNRIGNCYVHAMCLQAILREKGYNTQLIWVKDKTHYWLIINLNGSWKHIDATPSMVHSRYSLMNDAQRYETLSGRDWDRSAWPACN